MVWLDSSLFKKRFDTSGGKRAEEECPKHTHNHACHYHCVPRTLFLFTHIKSTNNYLSSLAEFVRLARSRDCRSGEKEQDDEQWLGRQS